MNKTISTTLAAAAVLVATCATAEPIGYTIESTHTSVTAESRHFGTSTVRSRFSPISGDITIDPAAKTGKAKITIDMTSVLTGIPKLDTHLKSEAFFDVANFPEATLVANSFMFDGDKVAQISGDLTMHGMTHPITLKATNYNCYLSPGFKKQVCGGDFETTIQRSQWGVKYLVPFVSDDTKLVVQIEALKN